jgi:hypothetical protein
MEVQMGEGASRSILDLPSDVLLRVLNEVDLFQQGAAILTCRKFKDLLYANTLRTTLDLSIAPVPPLLPPNFYLIITMR